MVAKKLKANVILTTFVLTLVLFFLGAFGTDTVYIIISRYELQKATEGLALEYASFLSQDISKRDAVENEFNTDLERRYRHVYNAAESGLLNFKIKRIEYYKNIHIKDYQRDKAIVEVKTTANVLPAFLRFVGVRGIEVNATARAKTQRMPYYVDDEIVRHELMEGYTATGVADANGFTFNFKNDTHEISGTLTNRPKMILTGKPRGNGDFTVTIIEGSDPDGEDIAAGGYFIFGGYLGDLANPNSLRWRDIGADTAEASRRNSMTINGNSYTCVDASDSKPVVFNLGDVNINKLTRIKIYKTIGTVDSTTGDINPCSICAVGDTCEDNNTVTIKIVVLNSVSLISKNEFESWVPGDGFYAKAHGVATFDSNGNNQAIAPDEG